MRHVDTLLSTYRADSDISRLNRRELAVGDCDPLVREVIDLCGQAKTATDGYFDASLPGGFDLATAAFARGESAWDWLDTLDGWQAIVVETDGTVRTSGERQPSR